MGLSWSGSPECVWHTRPQWRLEVFVHIPLQETARLQKRFRSGFLGCLLVQKSAQSLCGILWTISPRLARSLLDRKWSCASQAQSPGSQYKACSTSPKVHSHVYKFLLDSLHPLRWGSFKPAGGIRKPATSTLRTPLHGLPTESLSPRRRRSC